MGQLALYTHVTGRCPKEVPPDVEVSEGRVVSLETCCQLTQTTVSGFIVADIQTTATERRLMWSSQYDLCDCHNIMQGARKVSFFLRYRLTITPNVVYREVSFIWSAYCERLH